MSGLAVKLRASLETAADCSAVLAGAWSGITPADLARRPVGLAGRGSVPLGELCELTGTPDGSVRFVGEWGRADRLGAGLAEGAVVIEGDIGDEVGHGHGGRQPRGARQCRPPRRGAPLPRRAGA